jgi:hypothetical protein
VTGCARIRALALTLQAREETGAQAIGAGYAYQQLQPWCQIQTVV